MAFARKVWKLLVAIKDGLVLLFMLVFFGALYAVLSYRPLPATVNEGALLVKLDGVVVEEPAPVDPLALFFSSRAPIREHRLRDVVRAIEGAATDDRIDAVVIDMGYFLGAGQSTISRIGEAMDKVRAAKKPVLTHALFYADDGVQLASHASEIWVDPMGGAIAAGPGGSQLYYKGLIDRLAVNAHVYRVGTYKNAVEPYLLSEPSPASREATQALYSALWENWRDEVAKARPKAKVDALIGDAAGMVRANGGMAEAALASGLVDHIGTREQFADHVAEIVGEEDTDDGLPFYANTEYESWLEAEPMKHKGDAVGVITVSGAITDGESGSGSAGADTIANVLDKALNDDLAALVVRVDSPGGTVTGADRIRQAILRHKERGIPIIVSMGDLAASGGYWISTTGDTIFAEPDTITGSIGIFLVLPSFEGTLGKIGVNAAGYQTTPLSGQPDILGGVSPEMDALLQAQVDTGYERFTKLVSESRDIPLSKMENIAEGRVWDGGTARQLGLVDRFGNLDDAIAFAAKQAGLADGDWHAEYLEPEPDPLTEFFNSWAHSDAEPDAGEADMLGLIAARRDATAGRMASDLDRLLGRPRIEARCLECPVPMNAHAPKGSESLWQTVAARLFD